MNKRSVGAKYEVFAAEYLKSRGYKILKMNFRCRTGEIDIIAAKENYIIFAEVKYRKNEMSGFGSEAVDLKKQRTICQCAAFYLNGNGLSPNTPCRFDVIDICGETVRHIKNAFGGI